MSEKFNGKYRNESIRLQNWDYGWNAAYFVTICTQNRVCYFGNVADGKIVLNDVGKIAYNFWIRIPEHFPFIKLGNHVVMPNHIHGIVIIDKPNNVGARLIAPLMEPMEPTKHPGGITGNKNPMLHDNLSKIIRWYKGRTTFESHKNHPDFAWQSRFHDHIIRN